MSSTGKRLEEHFPIFSGNYWTHFSGKEEKIDQLNQRFKRITTCIAICMISTLIYILPISLWLIIDTKNGLPSKFQVLFHRVISDGRPLLPDFLSVLCTT